MTACMVVKGIVIKKENSRDRGELPRQIKKRYPVAGHVKVQPPDILGFCFM